MAGKSQIKIKKYNIFQYKIGRWDLITGVLICPKAVKNVSFASASYMSNPSLLRE